jgi:hypothetical protein
MIRRKLPLKAEQEKRRQGKDIANATGIERALEDDYLSRDPSTSKRTAYIRRALEKAKKWGRAIASLLWIRLSDTDAAPRMQQARRLTRISALAIHARG